MASAMVRASCQRSRVNPEAVPSRWVSQVRSGWATGCSNSSGSSSSTAHTSWPARQGSSSCAGRCSTWRTSCRRRLPGKGNRTRELMPLAVASCSPNHRLVGQVLTITSTVSRGPGCCSIN